MSDNTLGRERYEGFQRWLDRLCEAVETSRCIGDLGAERGRNGYLGRRPKTDRSRLPIEGGAREALRVIMPLLREVYARGAQYDETWVRARRPVYSTPAWKELRYRVLADQGARCKCCGATAADGATMHVDHIKPASLYPELALDYDNLQVLCDECNIGKSNKDETDWRVKNMLEDIGAVRPSVPINGKA